MTKETTQTIKETKKVKKEETTNEAQTENPTEESEKEEKLEKPTLMGKFLSEAAPSPMVGDLIEGKVLKIDKNIVFVDMQPFGTGIIYGREYTIAKDIIKNISPGDSVSGKIIDIEEKEGYFEISLKEARQAKVWNEAETAIRSEERR